MALQLSRTDPATGAPAPQAYARVDDSALQLAADTVSIVVSVYYDQAAAAAALAPIYVYPTIQLSAAEITTPNPVFVAALAALVQTGKINSPKDALKACLYVLLRQRPEFRTAVDV